MSIIKSILHKYNATSKAYDTLHPETESAQITDWNQGIVNTLASTALGGLVNTLTSDSLIAKMIQKVLTATGVKYNINQNGYICFGALFGNLIIQWGIAKEANHTTYEFPLAFSTKAFITVGTHVGTNTTNAIFIPHIDIKSRSSFVATFEQSPTKAWMYYIAIGY